jgi:hypothetical protein
MERHLALAVAAAAGAMFLPMRAFAQAVELAAATGYTQGFGTVQPGIGLPGVAGAGIGVEGSVGYRIEPHYAVSLAGQYQALQAERDEAARGFVWNFALQYHAQPHNRLDPWVELGAGYRLLWVEPFGPAPTVLFHGPQLVRVRAGLDVRISREVAIAPVIGADVTMLVFRDDVTARAIPEPTLNTFVFAGLQGRLDIPVGAPRGVPVE